jgi:glutamate-5-semialdehyde dehydrogenase
MAAGGTLERLEAGQVIVYGGDRVTRVPPELAAAFRPGDRLVVVQASGALLHVPTTAHQLADRAVSAAGEAFLALGSVPDDAITAFYEAFAMALEDDAVFAGIAGANRADVESARARGRSTTRLELSDAMRAGMIAGLRVWRDAPSVRDALVDAVEHPGWRVERRRAALGVVGFVFEGRPNVFADATGVLRGGNTVVFRIGSDALGTARAIHEGALRPALAAAGLPPGSAQLLDSPERATGLALFAHPHLALAVARGSGAAVAQLGAVARQAGTPVSLHGTGGAWMVAGRHAQRERFRAAVQHSLDRKVCNTLNVCCIVNERAAELVPVFLDALGAAARARASAGKVHVLQGSEAYVPPALFDRVVTLRRAGGAVQERQAELLAPDELGQEWEWEDSPEVTLAVVGDVDEAVGLFNRWSPRLVASLLSADDAEQAHFWATVDAPFVGDGFTRWVDGQFAFDRPELGLANWQDGRLFGRGGVLAGDSVHTVRTRAIQHDPHLHR